MIIPRFKKISLFTFLMVWTAGVMLTVQGQQVTPADPVTISADDTGGNFTTLVNGPVLTGQEVHPSGSGCWPDNTAGNDDRGP